MRLLAFAFAILAACGTPVLAQPLSVARPVLPDRPEPGRYFLESRDGQCLGWGMIGDEQALVVRPCGADGHVTLLRRGERYAVEAGISGRCVDLAFQSDNRGFLPKLTPCRARSEDISAHEYGVDLFQVRLDPARGQYRLSILAPTDFSQLCLGLGTPGNRTRAALSHCSVSGYDYFTLRRVPDPVRVAPARNAPPPTGYAQPPGVTAVGPDGTPPVRTKPPLVLLPVIVVPPPPERVEPLSPTAEPGVYRLQTWDGQCLEPVWDQGQDRVPIRPIDCARATPVQLTTAAISGSVVLEYAAMGRCLAANGFELTVRNCNAGATQVFRVSRLPNASFRMQPLNQVAHCWTSNAASVIFRPCLGNNAQNQQFWLLPAN